MSAASAIRYKQYSGQEVGKLYDKVKPIFDGEDPTLVVVTCLSVAILCQYPDLSVEELSKLVADTSEWMSLTMKPTEEPKEVMN